MAYLMHMTREGSLKELQLQKKITTLGPSKEADVYFSSPKHEHSYFQIVEKNKNYQLLCLTPHSYFLHQGKKKQAMDLAAYDVFEIENFKFIFSKKPFHPEKDVPNSLMPYQTFYRFSQALSEVHHPPSLLKKLFDLVLELSKSQKFFLF